MTKSDHDIRNTSARLAPRWTCTVAGCLGLITAQSVLAQPTCVPTSSWGLDRIDQRDALLDGEFCPPASGAGANIYVVGNGLRYTHVEFGGRAGLLYDYQGGEGLDCNGDGTFMGSLAAGSEFGVAKSAAVYTVRVGDCMGAIADPDLIVGLTVIAQAGQLPGVVVLPVVSCDAAVNGAIQDVIDAGFVVVAPAGNDGTDLCNPSCTPTVVADAIIVGATDDTDCRALYSNYGAGVDVFAPGDGVDGAGNASDFDAVTQTGDTAYAAAYVAGIVANYLSQNPSLLPAVVHELVRTRSTPISGCGETMRLAYSGLDDHPVPPGAPIVCNPCPMCGTFDTDNQAMTASIVGPVNGTDWSWKIVADNPGDFDDTPVVTVPGVTTDYNGDTNTDAMDVAQKWADSINAHFTAAGCDTNPVTGDIWATALIQFGTPYISVSAKCDFTIYVSDANVDPLDPTCAVVPPFTCQINPTVQPFFGSYTDCDKDGLDDFFATSVGLVADTNLDSVPDACQQGEVPAPEQGALGVSMHALGQAILTPSTDGRLVVHNIGTSLQDGFVASTGPIERLDLTFEDVTTPGAAAAWRIEPVDNIGTSLLDYRVEQTGSDTGRIVADLSALSLVDDVELEIFDNGVMTHSETVASNNVEVGGSARLAREPRRFYIRLFVSAEHGGSGGIEMCWQRGGAAHQMSTPSGATPQGNAVLMRIPTVAPQTLESLSTYLADMDAATMTGSSLGQFGNEHVGLNGTVMRGDVSPINPADPSIVISNIGSQGKDSPRLNWRVQQYGQTGSSAINVDTMPISLAQADRSLTLRSRGNIGTSLQDLGVASLVSTGTSSATVNADFSGLGSATTRAAVYDQGVFVGETIVAGAGPVGTITTVGGGDLFVSGCGKLPGELPCFVLHYPQDIIFGGSNPFAGSAPLQGDELRIIADEPSAPVDDLESLEIDGANLGEITVIGESFGDVTPDCPGDLDRSGDVGFTDLTALLGAWGPCGAGPCPADLDGDGVVGFTDLTSLLGMWGPCA